MHEAFMRRAITLSREMMRADEGGPFAAVIGFDDARLYRELALSAGERTLPMARLLPREALEVFREWASDPDRIPS